MDPFDELSATYIKNAIKRDTNAIDKFDRRNLSKKYGKNNFIVPPRKTIGKVLKKIDLSNFTFIK